MSKSLALKLVGLILLLVAIVLGVTGFEALRVGAISPAMYLASMVLPVLAGCLMFMRARRAKSSEAAE